MTEDKIFDEFNQLIKDLTDDLIRDTDDPYSDSVDTCLLYTSPSPRDGLLSRMPSSA